MSIDPATMTSIITYMPKLYDAEGADSVEASQEQGSLGAPSDDLDALERRFSALISGLTKQIAVLENSFSRAMRDIVKGYQTAAACQAAD